MENMNPENVDWQEIREVTGMTPEEIAAIQERWSRGPQTMEEVHEGVLWERKNRLAAADQPDGLTKQAKKLL